MNTSTKKIVFLGDSVTEGCFELFPAPYGFETVRRPEDGYAAKTANALRSKYGERKFDFLNFAVSGSSAYTAGSQAEKALSAMPDIAILSFGLNDALHPEERFGQALEALFLMLKKHISTLIFITPNRMNTYIHPATLPEAHKVAEKTMRVQTDGTFDRMIKCERALCKHHEIILCDAYAQWEKLHEAGVDITDACLVNHVNHPTPEMHDTLASMLTEIISDCL